MIREFEPGDWDKRLAELGIGDAYFSSGYVATAAILEAGRPVLLGLRGTCGEVLFPCIVRQLPRGERGVDVVSPYGYGGPVAVGTLPPLAAFESAYEEWCGVNHVVSTFIRFHPFLQNQAYAPSRTKTVRLAGTVVWDISAGRDLFADMRDGYPRAIRAMARRAVCTVSRGEAAFIRFRPIYEETMRRVGAVPFYFFPDSYWRMMLEKLGDRAVFFEASLDGELIASSLVLEGRPWLHCHLSATSERGRPTQVGKLLYYEAARWGQQNGFVAMHLGGGVGCREDSLLAFKLGFALGGLTPAFVGKMVHDSAQYRQLAGSDEIEGYFPAYRQAVR